MSLGKEIRKILFRGQLESTDVSVSGTYVPIYKPATFGKKLVGKSIESIGGGGSATVLQEDITYAALLAKKVAGTLAKGQQYKMTDYKTLNAGVVETLILTATSINTFDVRVQSVGFPKDVLEYDINGAGAGGSGLITYRKDDLNNSACYDFRKIATFGSNAQQCSLKSGSSSNVFGNNAFSIDIGFSSYSNFIGLNMTSIIIRDYVNNLNIASLAQIKYLTVESGNYTGLILGANSIALLQDETIVNKVLYIDKTDGFRIRYFDDSTLKFLVATT